MKKFISPFPPKKKLQLLFVALCSMQFVLHAQYDGQYNGQYYGQQYNNNSTRKNRRAEKVQQALEQRYYGSYNQQNNNSSGQPTNNSQSNFYSATTTRKSPLYNNSQMGYPAPANQAFSTASSLASTPSSSPTPAPVAGNINSAVQNNSSIEIRKNKDLSKDPVVEYYEDNVLQFSTIKNESGMLTLKFKAANDQDVSIGLMPVDPNICQQKIHPIPTPSNISPDTSIKARRADHHYEMTSYYDNQGIRSYKTTHYKNSFKEKYYDRGICQLDPHLEKDSSVSQIEFGLMLERDTNVNNTIIERFFDRNPRVQLSQEFLTQSMPKLRPEQQELAMRSLITGEVIKLYTPSKRLLLELSINILEGYVAQLTIYGNNSESMTGCYKVHSISGIYTDFYQHTNRLSELMASFPKD